MQRFSLKSLFFATAFVGLIAALVVSYMQRSGDLKELVELRNVAGRLEISDPNLVHAIPVTVAGDLSWQWQVYLPPEKEYEIVLFSGEDVPLHGMPERWSARTGFRKPGKFMLTASVEKNRHGEWVLTTEAQGQNLIDPIGDDLWGAHQRTGIESEKTTIGVAGKPLELLRIRTPETVKPPNGIMIMIEEYEHD